MLINSDIQERLKSGVEEAFKDLKPYLDMIAKQYNYSMRNTILICMANPHASIVGGYKRLLTEYDHQVKKGEKAIQILAPVTCSTSSDTYVKKLKEDIAKNGMYTVGAYTFSKQGQEIIANGRGQSNVEITDLKKFLKENIGQTVIVGFKSVNVFDISQTSPSLDRAGNPTAKAQKIIDIIKSNEIKPVKDSDFEKVARLFNAISKSTQAKTIDIDVIDSEAKGYFSKSNNAIVINDKNSYTQSLKTLIHEEVHCRLHGNSKGSRSDEEIQAEATAYVVTQHYGIDTSEYSFGYVASWSVNKEMGDLIKNLETINETAAKIIKDMDEKLEATKEISISEIVSNNSNMQNDVFLTSLYALTEAELKTQEYEQDLEM